MFFLVLILGLVMIFAVAVNAQSQALNGQIEGSISDQTGAAVSNAVVTVTNIETGANRTVTTDESGFYRFPLLALSRGSLNSDVVIINNTE